MSTAVANPGTASSSSAAARPSSQDITVQFNVFKQELQNLAKKIGELEAESDEHRLVIETLEPMNLDRTCFRLIGGVLVERTVEEVLPALKENQQGIKSVIEHLLAQYKAKEDEFVAFQKKFNIVIGGR